MKIIGLCGFISSGKDTAADYLVANYNFKRESFAGALKDIVSIIFGWDRELLEGRTLQSRQWRETEDTWWSNRLNMPITPRWVLQYWGTEVLRNNFHDEIWIASLERKLLSSNQNIVITDCRFPNEIKILKQLNGKVCRIQRGPDPEWFPFARSYMIGPTDAAYYTSKQVLEYKKIHASEYSWANTDFDKIIDNNSTIDNLHSQLQQLIQ